MTSSSRSGPEGPADKNGAPATTPPPTPLRSVGVLTDDDLSSNAQRERRKRILDSTLALASKGGVFR